jgi:MATE family multidrug resistance protein
MFRRELRELFRLALPIAAAQAGNQLMGVVDIAVLGRYSARDLAACGLGNAFYFAISVIGIGIVLGLDPLISQALGAGDRVRARRLLWQGVWLALIVAGILTVVLLLSPLALGPAGVKRELIEPATAYVVIRAVSLAPLLTFLAARAYLQAHGITRPMLIATVVANVFNLVADIVLVFGAGPLPPLGAAGAALATVAGTFLQLAIVAAAVRAIEIPGAAALHRWNGADVRRAFQVGWPIGLQMGAEVGIFALVGVLAGRLGTYDLAAHQVVISLASFTFTVAVGVAAAGSVRVGLAIGARDVMATRLAGRAAFIGGAGVMTVSALVFALAPRPLARLLTDEHAVIAVALPLFLVAAVFQLSDGVQAVGAGVLRGAGDTRYAFAANILGHWLIGFPVALLLGFRLKFGLAGLWWGLCTGLTVVAGLLFVRFKRLSATAIAPIQSH